MEDFSDSNINEEELSTVFSAPGEHKEKLKSPKRRKIVSVIASLLSVLLLVGGTVAVIKLIPKKEETDNSSQSDTVSVINFETNDLDTVSVKNENGSLLIVSSTFSFSFFFR